MPLHNRPDARNALSDTLTPALRRMIKLCGEDPAVGAVLLTGAGQAFCAGADVKGLQANTQQMSRPAAERVEQLKERQRTLTGVLLALRKPTIVALPGAAAGAGLSIALACDIRIAAASAFITTGYARVGLTGDYGVSWLLTRLVGYARARELMLLAERVDAARCEAIGLFNRVVPDTDLHTAAFDLALSLAQGPTEILGAIKDNLDYALDADFLSSLDHEAEQIVRYAASAQHKEAISAVVEKRKPHFH